MNELCAEYLVLTPYQWVRNGCIVFDKEIREIYQKERVEEPGTVITHGLTSSHTHLGLYPIRTTVAFGLRLDDWVGEYAWPWEKFLMENPELSYHISIIAIEEMAANGVTAFADMHFNEEEVLKAVIDSGMKADLSVAIMNRGVFSDYRHGVDENLKLLKKAQGHSRIKVRFGPCTPRLLTPKEFRNVVDTAKEHGVGIHTHLAEVKDDELWLMKNWGMNLRDFIRYTQLDCTDSLIAHAIWIESAIDILSRSTATLIHLPRSNVYLGDGHMPVYYLVNRGAKVSIGIDIAPTYNIRDDMKAFLMLNSGMMTPALIELPYSLATEAGYKALQLGTGSIRVGEPADIVMWRTEETPEKPHPLASVMLTNMEASEVYVDGELILKDGVLTRLGEDRVENSRIALKEYIKSFRTGSSS